VKGTPFFHLIFTRYLSKALCNSDRLAINISDAGFLCCTVLSLVDFSTAWPFCTAAFLSPVPSDECLLYCLALLLCDSAAI
jgi:hypothetical protein